MLDFDDYPVINNLSDEGRRLCWHRFDHLPLLGIMNYTRRRMMDPGYLAMWQEDPTKDGDAGRLGLLLWAGRMMEPPWVRKEKELRKKREAWRAERPA